MTPRIGGFGRLARDARVAAEMTLKEVADELGYTAAYVSDIERANRRPPDIPKVRQWAELLDADMERFERYARLDRKMVEIAIDHDDLDSTANRAAIAVARSWTELSEDEYEAILAVIGRRSREQ